MERGRALFATSKRCHAAAVSRRPSLSPCRCTYAAHRHRHADRQQSLLALVLLAALRSGNPVRKSQHHGQAVPCLSVRVFPAACSRRLQALSAPSFRHDEYRRPCLPSSHACTPRAFQETSSASTSGDSTHPRPTARAWTPSTLEEGACPTFPQPPVPPMA